MITPRSGAVLSCDSHFAPNMSAGGGFENIFNNRDLLRHRGILRTRIAFGLDTR
jgi:hypothetical protein